MKTTIGRTGVSPQQLYPVLDKIAARQAENKAELRRLQAEAWDAMEKAPPSALKTKWEQAVAKNVGIDKAFYSLLDAVAPMRYDQIVAGFEEDKALGQVTKSFQALCQTLQSVEAGPEKADINPLTAKRAYGARAELLSNVRAIREALAAAGDGVKEVGLFPKAQLDKIEERARTDAQALAAERDHSLAGLPKGRVLTSADLKTTHAAADAIGRVLSNEGLAVALAQAAEKVKPAEKAEFQANLAALAVLADTLRTAPDYATTGAGWGSPRARLQYRERQFDSWDLYAAEPRRENTEHNLTKLAEAVAGSASPAEALAKGLVATFVREVGVQPNVSEGWKPTAAGVRKAIDHELFLPLRSLNENLDQMTSQRGAAAHAGAIRGVVHDVTKHVVEGDYREWRYESPKSQKQLSVLSPKQKDQWKTSLHLESPSAAGGKLKTREEDDVELLWVTKIGGPSHGFDVGPHCLLPLIANGRTKAILVDDDRWPHNAAARCYLRVLSREDGSPVLYLEPLQRDFPHGDKFKGDREDAAFRLAQVQHALAKAKEMGVPLTVSAYDDFALEHLGVRSRPDHQKIVIEPSAGVFEASDTMFEGHDFPQTERITGFPRGARVVVDPKDIGGLA